MRVYGWGLVRSMVIAYKNLFRKKITVQYPHEKIALPERARWAVEPRFYEDGDPKCTACGICERTCPGYVIKIETTTLEDKSKRIDRWRYEIGACMMCGLCAEACPFDAIRMGQDYELARTDPATLAIDLLANVPAAQPKRRAEAAAAAVARSVDTVAQAEPAAPTAPGGPPAKGDADVSHG